MGPMSIDLALMVGLMREISTKKEWSWFVGAGAGPSFPPGEMQGNPSGSCHEALLP